MVELFHEYDLYIIPLAIFFFFMLGRYISRRIYSREMRSYFTYGLVVKMLAAIIYGIIIQYYFGGGDTNRYYIGLLDLKKAIADDPANLFRIFGNIQLEPDSPLASYFASDKLGDSMLYFVKTSNYMVPRFGLIPSYLTGNSYTALSMFYSFFAFWGCWKCFTVFASIYPQMKKGMAICFLFCPSVVYWGSGIMKDSICLGSMTLFIYSFYFLFLREKNILLHLASVLLWGSILFFTKPYLLLTLTPLLSLWYLLQVNKNIKAKSIRFMTFGITMIVISISVYLLIQFLLSQEFLDLEKYKVENFMTYASQFQEGYRWAGGSNLNIGNLDGSFSSFAGMFPRAVNATLFRPYLWEANNVIMLINAMESLVIFVLFIFILYKLGIRKFFNIIFSSPLLVFLFVYSIFFSGMVAITTTNFGTLSRYKISVMPFFLALLFVLLSHVSNIRYKRFLAKHIFSPHSSPR